jgi:hypothetical protein
MTGSEGGGRAQRYSKAAVDTLRDAETSFNSDPLFQAGRELAMGLAANPQSLSPEIVEMLKANFAQDAQMGARSSLDQGLSGLSGTSGVRSGSANKLRGRVAQEMGGGIATGNRDIDIAAAQQRPADIMNAVNLVTQILGQQYQFPRDISNAYLGSGSLLTQLSSQPSQLQQIGGGLGGLLGNVFSAAGAAKGFGNLFGSSQPQ